MVHELRSAHDAVVTGSGTVLADDPLLTVRDAPLRNKPPMRVVMDRRGRIPDTARILNSAEDGPVLRLSDDTPAMALDRLRIAGVSTVLLECGATLAAAFLAADLIDRVEWFRAPILIGGDGLPSIASLGLTDLGEARRFRLEGINRLGEDLHESYVRL